MMPLPVQGTAPATDFRRFDPRSNAPAPSSPNFPTPLNGSGPLSGLRRRARSEPTTPEPQIPTSLEEAQALRETLEEQAYSGQITEESYRLQCNALARTVSALTSTHRSPDELEALLQTAIADIHQGAPLEHIMSMYSALSPAEHIEIQAAAQRVIQTGIVRVPELVLNRAIAHVYRGDSLGPVRLVFNIRHPLDLAALDAAAEDVLQNGVDRAPQRHLNSALRDMRRTRMSLREVAIRHHIHHPDDLAQLQTARRRSGNGIHRILGNTTRALGSVMTLYKRVRHERAPELIMEEVFTAISQGVTPTLITLIYPGLRHPDDLAAMEAAAQEVSRFLY